MSYEIRALRGTETLIYNRASTIHAMSEAHRLNLKHGCAMQVYHLVPSPVRGGRVAVPYYRLEPKPCPKKF